MLTTILAGLSVGAIYALVALGYNLVFIPAGVVNFAQAALIMAGGYISYWALIREAWSPFLVVPFTAVAVGAIALIEEQVAIRPIFGRGRHGELVTTLGFAILLEGIVSAIWGSVPLAVPVAGLDRFVTVLGGRAAVGDVVLIAVAVFAGFAAHSWMRRSVLGLAGLAASEDRESASMRGINVRTLTVGAVLASGMFSGLLALVIATKTFAVPTLGDELAVKGFVAFAVGGFGNLRGAVFGGLATGLVEAIAQRYVGGNYVYLMIFAVLISVLLLKPNGLFATRVERMV